ncbi:MAG: hypothetical protein ABR964_13350 [Tepidisphaeraceae bacterium]|jgi:hypothetical protein
MNKRKPPRGEFVVCVDCTDDDIDLVFGKLYRVARPEKNDPPSMLRVIDDSGEDYLYPVVWFISVHLPQKAKKALVAVGS